MLNDRLLYKKVIRALGKDKSGLASKFKFANDYEVEALKLVNKDNYSKALLFDTEDSTVLKILGDEDIEKTIYIAGGHDLRSLDRHNWIALEYLKNHKFIEYAFSYNGEYKIRSLVG